MQSLRLPILLRRVWWWKDENIEVSSPLKLSRMKQSLTYEVYVIHLLLRWVAEAAGLFDRASVKSSSAAVPSTQGFTVVREAVRPSFVTILLQRTTSWLLPRRVVHFKWPSTFCSSPRNSSSQYLVFNFVFSKVETFVSSGTDEVRAKKRDPSLRNESQWMGTFGQICV